MADGFFQPKQQDESLFYFMNFGNETTFGESPLSSPFLLEDGTQLISSDLSSPDISSPSPSTEFLFSDQSLQSFFVSGDSMEQMETLSVLDDSSSKMETNNQVKISEETTNKKTKKGRGKKRARSNSEENTDVSAVILTREQILTFSSEDLEQFISRITNLRPLTYSEEKELKRQKRLIKNRESAQASRQRKKVYVDELETEIANLKNQNSQLTNQVGQLVVENRDLKDELKKLHTLVKKTGLLSNDTKSSKSTDSSNVGSHQKVGVYLLILMFSFGLF